MAPTFLAESWKRFIVMFRGINGKRIDLPMYMRYRKVTKALLNAMICVMNMHKTELLTETPAERVRHFPARVIMFLTLDGEGQVRHDSPENAFKIMRYRNADMGLDAETTAAIDQRIEAYLELYELE